MLDVQKIAAFLVEQRRKLGMTQVDVANKLNVSYQAVSKWENGTLPNVEILAGLAQLFHVTVDEILAGRKKGAESLSYSRAGVDVAYTNAIKKEIAAYLQTDDPRVLNELPQFVRTVQKKPLCRKYSVLSRVALRQWRHSCFCLDALIVIEMNVAIYHLICFLERARFVPVDTFRFQD